MNLLDFVRGYARYVVKADKPERVLDLLRKEIAVTYIKTDENLLEFTCPFTCCKMAEKVLSESGAVTDKKLCKGLFYIVSKYKKRFGLILGLAAALIFIFLSTLFVWDIRIEGNENVPDKQIIKQLENIGFTTGLMKRKVNTESIVNYLLINEERLSWAAINFDGTVAHVEVREAKIAKRYEKKQNVNLVASCNGIIIRVDALDGSAVVSKDDTVLRGQMLVSAFVEKRTGGSILKGARGYVWARTSHSYSVEVPIMYSDKVFTGRKRQKVSFSVLGKNFRLPSFGKDDFFASSLSVYDGKLKLNEKMYLPVDVRIETTKEYEIISKRRTEKIALDEAAKTAVSRLFNEHPSFTLAEKKEEHRIKDGKLIYTCTFTGVENIAEPLEFELS